MALFTRENAAEFQRRGVEAKLAAKDETLVKALTPEVEHFNAENYRKLRLLRARKMLDKLDEKIFRELDKEGDVDASALDRMASAALRFNEQERQLSNRSLPPTLKASQPRTKRSASADPEPE
jgi:hypothetical protein